MSWAEDDNLTVVHYFEMDESERGTVGVYAALITAVVKQVVSAYGRLIPYAKNLQGVSFCGFCEFSSNCRNYILKKVKYSYMWL